MQKQQQERQHAVAAGLVKEKQTTSLTAHLQTTTESVMKMKLQLESEVKQRDSKIAELQNTIKEMTKNLINLQQHSESISHKLQYELLKRGNITVKFESTRNICSTLQEHIKYLAETLKRCTEEKDIMKTVQLEYLTELEALVAKTKDCQKTLNEVSQQRDSIVQKYNHEKQTRLKLMDEVSALKQDFAKMLGETKEAFDAAKLRGDELAEQVCQKDAALGELKAQHESIAAQLRQIEQSAKENLETAIAEKDDILLEKNAELAQLTSDIQSYRNTIEQLEKELTRSIECVAAKDSEICSITSKLMLLQQELNEKNLSLEAVLSEKISLVEKVNGIATLEAEIEELKDALNKSTEEMKIMEEKYKTSDQKCLELESKLSETKHLISQGQAQSQELTLEIGLLKEGNENLQQELNNVLEELKRSKGLSSELEKKLENEMKDKESLQQTLDVLRSSNAMETGEMASKVAQLSSSLAKCKTELGLKADVISSLTDQVNKLQSSLDVTVEQLCNERKTGETLTGNLNKELDGKVREIEDLTKSRETLQENVVHLEEVISQMQNQLKDASTENETYLNEKKELEKTLKTINSEKNSAETKLKRLETKVANLEKEKKELKAKITKAKADNMQESEKKDQALSDFEEALKEKDEHAVELEQIIADLKKANEEELSAHEAKLNDSLAENSKLASKVEQMNKHTAELEAKVAKLTTQLSDTIKNLDETSAKYESQKQKMKEKLKISEQLVSSKEAEITKLSQSSQTNAKKPTFEIEVSKKSIMRGSEKVGKLIVAKKIRFRDNVSFISWDGDEDSVSSGHLAPGTPVKTQNVPTTPRKTLRSPMRKIISDDEDEFEIDTGKSSKSNDKYSTPTKRMATSSGDGHVKTKKVRT